MHLMCRSWLIVPALATLAVTAACKKQEEKAADRPAAGRAKEPRGEKDGPAPAAAAVPPAKGKAGAPVAADGAIKLTREKAAAGAFTPTAAIASADTGGTGGFTVFLIGDCPAVPADACEWLPKGWANTDYQKLISECPTYHQVAIRFGHEQGVSPAVAATDVKAGVTYGRNSSPIRGTGLQYSYGDPTRNFDVYGETLVEIRKADADHVAGMLVGEDPLGNAIIGPFDARICQYP